ncbi:MAG TPA: carbon-nitrogen hydrolase family protein [Hyphomicrobium sp.]|jgi:deaminated glutathione amidase|nr:carbon-nitrogen hydrolase family protein [Hyphomicrobium sp.]
MADTGHPRSFRVGLVQMCSGRDVERNVNDATDLIRRAKHEGADYIQTPEMTTIMELDRARLLAAARPEPANPVISHFQSLARELGVFLHIGSMAILVSDGRLANRSFLFSPAGDIAARYDKIHMFDVDLGGGESYRESANYEPGRRAVLADLPWGKLGLTICYDLRFPHLYRALARAGARFLAIPSAFTRPTGMAHWHTLLRARAIESQAFVFAAAQGGMHENGRETFGHSLIVSPWGELLAEAGVHPTVIVADVELQLLEDVRRRVPSLQHDRAFDVVHAAQDASDKVVP